MSIDIHSCARFRMSQNLRNDERWNAMIEDYLPIQSSTIKMNLGISLIFLIQLEQ